MTCELEDPYILIHEKKLSNLQSLLPLLESVVKSSQVYYYQAYSSLIKSGRVWDHDYVEYNFCNFSTVSCLQGLVYCNQVIEFIPSVKSVELVNLAIF